ncbi:phosphatase PAP2 family protein [Bacillus sp. FJAT-44742]|uniref:phosphatase PAP2 family protein n=1 Tax=Bacillus sp. FJAT-44742 TaxID=2014005 RepID=UPI000C2494AB|nr:phosphatase PAP2 family protein [Bacillus sp. FJAT-44742]
MIFTNKKITAGLALMMFVISFLIGSWTFAIDFDIFHWFQGITETAFGQWLYNAALIFSSLGAPEIILFVTIFSALVLWIKKYRFEALSFVLLTGTGIVFNYLLKVFFQRERPGEARSIEVFQFSLDIPSFSFPSGHTMRITLLCLLLFYVWDRVIRKGGMVKGTVILLLFVIAIGTSLARVVLGWHYPTDILAAILFSLGLFLLFYSGEEKLRGKFQQSFLVK